MTTTTGTGLVVHTVRSDVAADVLAAGPGPVRLTWTLHGDRPDGAQLGYEIEVAAEPGFDPGTTVTSGDVSGPAQVAVEAPGGRLASREVRYHRVRVRSASGWSPWSDVVRVEAGLLAPDDWLGGAITLPDDRGAIEPSPAPVLRRAFEINAPVRRARLYVTSLGVHRMTINGRAVTADLFGPGWTPYGRRLLVETYDVTDHLVLGENVLGGVLGDGWYRGRIGWAPGTSRCRYGSDVALLAQLEVTDEHGITSIVSTDGSWRSSTAEIRSADLYDGSRIDLREGQPGWDRPGFDDGAWRPVVPAPIDLGVLEPRIAPPVRVIDTRPVDPTPLDGGGWRLDGGQNVAGWVRLGVRGSAGTTVTVRHAEVLEPDGSLHTRSLRSAEATDTYVLADESVVELEPAFTFHGFRYAEIQGDVDLLETSIVAISSVAETRGRFTCSDPLLERLHENVVWSLRDNFVSVPTDCPQRDERLGWTGDAQAFAATASVLVDSRAFWTSWLRDLALEQDPILGVPTVVPDVVLTGEPRYGRAGWSDAATIVPWAVYEAYGDVETLRAAFPSMCAHVDSLDARRAADGLLPEGMQFGDWLDPDAPSHRPWEAKADSRYIANAFLVHSARLIAAAAHRLDQAGVAARYERLAADVAAVTWATWSDHVVTTQTGCAMALELGVAPADERTRIGQALADLVRAADGAVATGFLGTPLVLPALAATGHHDEAYQMLLRRDAPSWLYQVVAGGTTVWERWDAIRPDGSIHDGRMTPIPGGPSDTPQNVMLSFNHYAYGAVVDWVYRHLAGIAPAAPGYREIAVAPRPVRGIDRASAEVSTPYGRAAVAWTLEADELRIQVDIPTGTTGRLDLPVQSTSEALVDGRRVETMTVAAGRHEVIVRHPRVAAFD